MTRPLICAALLWALSSAPAPAQTTAPPAAPLHLAVTKPLTPFKDVLASLSRQSRVPILADDTVVDTLGVSTLDKPTLEDALNALVPLGQGASWQRVYLPQDAPLPDAATLSAQVRALKSVTTSLLVVDPAQPGALSFAKSAASAPATPPAGTRVVYLVTNESVRAQRLADQAAAKKAAAAPAPPVDQAVTGMQTAADDLGKMTPDEQRQAIPLMMQQMMRMMQSIDPGVRAELGQQWRQQRGAGGGATGQ